MPNTRPKITTDLLLVNRPISTNGLPTGTLSQSVDGSSTAVKFYVEALPGERLAIARAIVNIIAATDIDALEYGDIGGGLTNGIDLIYQKSGVWIKVSGSLPIKVNEDWGRWCYDSRPVTVGPTSKTPAWQARWTFINYGNPYGIVLDEGEKLGLQINDNLSGLSEDTVIMEGVHLGTPDTRWQIPLT